jgi:hypothetical protein
MSCPLAGQAPSVGSIGSASPSEGPPVAAHLHAGNRRARPLLARTGQRSWLEAGVLRMVNVHHQGSTRPWPAPGLWRTRCAWSRRAMGKAQRGQTSSAASGRFHPAPGLEALMIVFTQPATTVPIDRRSAHRVMGSGDPDPTPLGPGRIGLPDPRIDAWSACSGSGGAEKPGRISPRPSPRRLRAAASWWRARGRDTPRGSCSGQATRVISKAGVFRCRLGRPHPSSSRL